MKDIRRAIAARSTEAIAETLTARATCVAYRFKSRVSRSFTNRLVGLDETNEMTPHVRMLGSILSSFGASFSSTLLELGYTIGTATVARTSEWIGRISSTLNRKSGFWYAARV